MSQPAESWESTLAPQKHMSDSQRFWLRDAERLLDHLYTPAGRQSFKLEHPDDELDRSFCATVIRRLLHYVYLRYGMDDIARTRWLSRIVRAVDEEIDAEEARIPDNDGYTVAQLKKIDQLRAQYKVEPAMHRKAGNIDGLPTDYVLTRWEFPNGGGITIGISPEGHGSS